MSKITLKTINNSIDRLATSVLKSFEQVESRLDRLEHGQEEILLKIDYKADKIDFPEVYPEPRKPGHKI